MQFADDEISSRVTLDDGTVLGKCELCRPMHAERNPPTEPPCETCKTELKEENEEAASVYMAVRRQYITAEQGRVVDISIPAIKIIMDLYQVKNKRECLGKVHNLFHEIDIKKRNGLN